MHVRTLFLFRLDTNEGGFAVQKKNYFILFRCRDYRC